MVKHGVEGGENREVMAVVLLGKTLTPTRAQVSVRIASERLRSSNVGLMTYDESESEGREPRMEWYCRVL